MSTLRTAVVVDLNSTAVQASLSVKDTPDVSIAPVYSQSKTNAQEYVFDPLLPRSADDELYTLFNDGILYNKAATAPLLRHVYDSLKLTSGSNQEDVIKEFPLAMAQNAWFDKRQLATLAEIVFEELQVPLFSLHERQLCTAYAMSKPNSCIIVDFENDYLSVTPISNGKVLRKGMCRSPFAGDFINMFAKQYLNSRGVTDTELLPMDYSCVESSLSPSFRNYAISQTLSDFKKSVLDISPVNIDAKVFKTPGNAKSINVERLQQIAHFIQPIFKPYDCYNNTFMKNTQSQAHDQLQSQQQAQPHVSPDAEGLGQLIFKSLKNLGGASQLYANLLNNLVIQGDMSFVPGLEDAIINDLRLYVKDFQISSYLNQDNMDRGVETWIGANILSQFDDLYVSRAAYEEAGPDSDILSRRFFSV